MVLSGATDIEVREEQLAKAMSPILVTELGIVTEERLVQPKKVRYPILVTELGRVVGWDRA